MKYLPVFLIAFFSNAYAEEKHPDCSGIQRWATRIAYGTLKNEGILTQETTDYAKTVTQRIASEKIEGNLYKQVHLITFTKTTGGTVQVITVNDASFDECSESEVETYVISNKLQ